VQGRVVHLRAGCRLVFQAHRSSGAVAGLATPRRASSAALPRTYPD
jgi:hypothetical protein